MQIEPPRNFNDLDNNQQKAEVASPIYFSKRNSLGQNNIVSENSQMSNMELDQSHKMGQSENQSETQIMSQPQEEGRQMQINCLIEEKDYMHSVIKDQKQLITDLQSTHDQLQLIKDE